MRQTQSCWLSKEQKNDRYAHKNHININFYHFLSLHQLLQCYTATQPARERKIVCDIAFERNHTAASSIQYITLFMLLPRFLFIFDCFSFFVFYSTKINILSHRHRRSSDRGNTNKPNDRAREREKINEIFFNRKTMELSKDEQRRGK